MAVIAKTTLLNGRQLYKEYSFLMVVITIYNDSPTGKYIMVTIIK